MSGFGEDEADQDITLEVSVNSGPVYDYRGQINGEACCGLQCSSHPDVFCFLCRFADYSEATDPGEEDAVTGIENMITRLADNQEDIANVVAAIYKQYNHHVRPDVMYVNPATKKTLEQPEWTRDSIQRHIVFSSKWPTLFDSIQTATLRGVLIVEANSLLDLDTGEIIQENKQAYFKSLDRYDKWQRSLATIGSTRHRQRALGGGGGVSDNTYYKGPRIDTIRSTSQTPSYGRAQKRSSSRTRRSTRSATPCMTPPREI
jgi:hypothetical protein